MNIPKLFDPTTNENTMERAEAVRSGFLEVIMSMFQKPHKPEFTAEQIEKVRTKIVNLLETDTRPQFWLGLHSQTVFNVVDGVIIVKPMILKWAGLRKSDSPKEMSEKQKIKHAKNGRVIRSPKGLS